MEQLVTPAQMLYIVLGAIAVVLLVGWLVYSIDRRMKAALIKAATAFDQKAAAEEAEELQSVLHWKVLYKEECRKREEVLRMIAGIQAERDRWKDIFWQCSSEHGVAQEYMVRVNQHFAQALKRNGDVKMNELWRTFKDRYGDAAKTEIAGRIARGEPGISTELKPWEGTARVMDVTAPAASVFGKGEESAVVVAKPDPNA